MAKQRIVGAIAQSSYSNGTGWDYALSCGHRGGSGGLFLLEALGRPNGPLGQEVDCATCDAQAEERSALAERALSAVGRLLGPDAIANDESLAAHAVATVEALAEALKQAR